MPQLFLLGLVGFFVYFLIVHILVPLFVYVFLVATIAVGVSCAAALMAVGLGTFLASSIQGSRPTPETHFAMLQGDGWLSIDLRIPNQPSGSLTKTSFKFITLISLAVALIVLNQMYELGEVLTFGPKAVPVEVTYALLAISSSIALLLSTGKLMKAAGWRAPTAQTFLLDGWAQILQAGNRARVIFDSLGAPDCFDVGRQVQTYVANHQEEVLANPQVVADFLNSQLHEVTTRAELAEQAFPRWEEVDQLLSETARRLIGLNSRACIKELDRVIEIHRLAAGLLLQGDGPGFFRTMDEIAEDALALQAIAKAEKATAHNQTKPAEDPLRSAYTLLGIAYGSSRAQVEPVVRRLLQTYHPDKGIVTDDVRFKEIMSAWELIKKHVN
ncbi:J domain-containing protein [Hydrogenophaga sp. NH-16]|uniref:J domain-containing protein n=1 Tax=Hydrogenophaga sp. NH-16 TaxID=2184519 RepID=UPI000FD714C4|nr:J domain-containing protein [Hydrogenophaga sp. NH-16]